MLICSLLVDSFTTKIDFTALVCMTARLNYRDDELDVKVGLNEASPPPPRLLKDSRCTSASCAGISQLRDAIESGQKRFCFTRQRLIL